MPITLTKKKILQDNEVSMCRPNTAFYVIFIQISMTVYACKTMTLKVWRKKNHNSDFSIARL